MGNRQGVKKLPPGGWVSLQGLWKRRGSEKNRTKAHLERRVQKKTRLYVLWVTRKKKAREGQGREEGKSFKSPRERNPREWEVTEVGGGYFSPTFPQKSEKKFWEEKIRNKGAHGLF